MRESREKTVPLPLVRRDIELGRGQTFRDGSPAWFIHDPVRNRYLHIGWLEFEIFKRWNMRNAEHIANAILDQTALDIVPEDVTEFARFLAENDLILAPSPQETAAVAKRFRGKIFRLQRSGLKRRVFFRIPLFHPDQFLEATLPVARILVSRPSLVLLCLIGVMALFLVVRQWDACLYAFRSAVSWQSVPMMLIALMITKCFHELGHAWAAKYYGLSVPTIGIAFFVVWPFLYTDTTAVWRLRKRRERIVVGAAGMAAELYIAVIATALWNFLPDGGIRSAVFFLATASWVLTLIVNANPFMRWDGYYILSDVIRIENLHGRSFAFGRWKLREMLFALGEPPPENQTKGIQHFLVGYAWCTWLYRVALFAGMALLAYNYLFKVIGLIAMFLAIAWFIAGPLFAEFRVWLELRSKMKANLNITATLLLVAVLITAVLFPWQRHIVAPAAMHSANMTPIYTARSGLVRAVNIGPGTRVETGDVLFELESDQLLFQRAIAMTREQRYVHAITRQSEANFLEQRDLLNEKLIEARTSISGLDEQLHALSVRAAFSGEITSLSDELAVAQWVSSSTPLAMLVDTDRIEVMAFVDEVQLGRLVKDRLARFYPEDPALGAIELEIIEVGSSRTRELPTPILAAPFGGDIAVSEDNPRKPLASLYPVRLRTHTPLPEPLISVVSRGSVHFAAQSISVLDAAVRHVTGVLRRESGF